LSHVKDTLAPVVTSLCNCSFQADILPAAQKQAIVLPRLKKPTLDSTKLSSYRPISNLSFISKLVEHVAASIFVRHAEKNVLFSVHQSWYQHGHSTETVALCPQWHCVRCRWEMNRCSNVIRCECRVVDHSTLLTVLQQRFSVCNKALTWLQSYLSDRTQKFFVDGVMLQSIIVNCNRSDAQRCHITADPVFVLSRLDYCNSLWASLHHAPTSNHYTEYSMQLLIWCLILVFVITWHQRWSSYTGYLSNTESNTSCVHWCMKFTLGVHHSTFLTLCC